MGIRLKFSFASYESLPLTSLVIFVPGEVRENLPRGIPVMPMKKYKPEQIVNLLRQIEVDPSV